MTALTDHELATQIAQQAGRLLADLQAFSAAEPAPDDDTLLALRRATLGDEGDSFAQEVLSRLLAVHRPADSVLSEEAPDDKARLTAERVWIIDPLDGTREFAMEGDEYAVHVALWQRDSKAPGNIAAAAVHVPARDSVLSAAEPGDVAEPSRDDIRLLVSRTRPLRELDAVVAALAEGTGRQVTTVPFGSVGAKVAHIIGGGADIYINTQGFNEWDLAAPFAVAKAYGLEAVDPTGLPIVFNQPDTAMRGVVVGRPDLVPLAVAALA